MALATNFESYAGGSCNFREKNFSSSKFCCLCNASFTRTEFYRHRKSNNLSLKTVDFSNRDNL